MKVKREARTLSPDDFLRLDLPRVRKVLARFVAREVRRSGFEGVVLGLSGGVDSCLAAAIAAEGLGPENVHAVRLPYRTGSRESLDDAEEVARFLRIPMATIDVSPMADGYFERAPDMDRGRKGNLLARLRMSILYDLSQRDGLLVLGTSNKTEILLGYTTIHGDNAHAIDPLGDLYKTQVWDLSRTMGLPERLVAKVPTADLWEGQTDEGELGFTYRDADRVLVLLVDQRFRPEEVVARGFPEDLVRRVVRRIVGSQFKRRPTIVPKISPRTVPIDFRYLRDWGT